MQNLLKATKEWVIRSKLFRFLSASAANIIFMYASSHNSNVNFKSITGDEKMLFAIECSSEKEKEVSARIN